MLIACDCSGGAFPRHSALRSRQVPIVPGSRRRLCSHVQLTQAPGRFHGPRTRCEAKPFFVHGRALTRSSSGWDTFAWTRTAARLASCSTAQSRCAKPSQRRRPSPCSLAIADDGFTAVLILICIRIKH